MTSSPNNLQVEAILQRVNKAYNELQQVLAHSVSQVPSNKLYEIPAENEWTVMENLGHIVEFMPYWADEVAKLVAVPGQKFGRTMQHEGRLQAIREYGSDSLAHAKAVLPGSYAHLVVTLAALRDSDLVLTGVHPKFGERPLAWFIEEFITRHLENHVEQNRACLQAVQ